MVELPVAQHGAALARGDARRALALAAAIAAAYLALASRSTLWDRDEPRFAQAAVEMAASGDWLVPTFNGRLRPDKPILVYWPMAAAVRWLGPGEVPVRLVAPLSLGVAAWLVGLLGAWLFSARAGLLAMAILATTPLVFLEGAAATADALLLAWLAFAMAVFAHGLLRGWRPRHDGLFALAIAGAMLTKGPVGLAVPVASALAALALTRDSGLPRRRIAAGVVLAALAGCGIFLLWAIPADRATGGELARRGLGHHVVERMLVPLESHGGNYLLYLPYYAVVLPLAFLPWTLDLGRALAALRAGRLGDERARALLVGWTVPTFAMMTLVATKLPHYILPMWPALALAAGAAVDRARTQRRAVTLAWVCVVLGTVFAAAGLPALEDLKAPPRLAAEIRARTSQAVPVATFRYREPSLVFYLRRWPVEDLPSDEAVAAWSRRPGAAVLVLPRAAATELEARHGPLRLEPIAAAQGFNFVKGEWVDLVALERHGGRRRAGGDILLPAPAVRTTTRGGMP